MYKMTLKYKELELAVESPTLIVNDLGNYEDFMKNIVKMVDKPSVTDKNTSESNETIENKGVILYNNHTHTEAEHDAPVIRERLPSRSNVVDLSKLDIKTAPGTAYSQFRCPDCGQSAVLIANGQPVVRDIVHDDACFSVDFDLKSKEPLEYETACANTVEEIRFITGEGMNSTCPKCEATYPTEEFVNAYYNPLDYFESETPCPLCGETLLLATKNGKTYLSCEGTCTFEKEVQKD